MHENKVRLSTQDKRDKDENNFTRRSQEICPNLCNVQKKIYRYILFHKQLSNLNIILTSQTKLHNSPSAFRVKFK